MNDDLIRKTVIFDGQPLSIEDIGRIAHRQAFAELSWAPAFVERIDKGARFIETLLNEQGFVYGVTTGFGDSCTVQIPLEWVNELSRHLYTFHGCGLGEHFSDEETRAILAVRLNSLAQGYSGVRYLLLQRLAALLAHDILPLIPKEGSVGASGDLTPLSYVAAVLAGEREVLYQGERRSAGEVFAKLGIEPLELKPKEGLAIMNGTAAMTGVACLAYQRAEYLARLATRITSLASIALTGNAYHYDEKLFTVKPHPGQNRVAGRIRADLQLTESAPRHDTRLQDRYSLRCAPHVIGVLEDALPWLRQFIENELNSANDNPIIDAEGEHVLHGGHFYGGHIAFAMDSMKTAVANLADLLDRQMAQLMDPKFNHGLPANLSGATGPAAGLNHGFKAVQIAVSAWTAEALKLTMPASVFSRSTECHNQDKVSMGTIAARDCIRIIELTEQAAAAMLLAAVQGVELRGGLEALSPAIVRTLQQVRERSPFLSEDRSLEKELRLMVASIRDQGLLLYGTG
ncbi:aromatic amino acid ammonia-lyase [Methylomicrobium sp. Wu6]|uniref:HAL/PAL/TAL family ammonia-lyase n=1 Tax=Methylomicrobium sp. Wu6 TaxID=3107928 RepID=UPI002DD6B8C3|nr:aromatic amino acid ammonia-lyase [Methylomicrobium sp. Wu6]MEC4747116.1 aromatic amino acid ammonia-lyase [Methylomicrobium sp. Wu6]